MHEYRKVLDEVQPHVYAAVAAAVAIAAAAAGQASQNKANRARKRNNANANQLGSQGQMDVTAPTATRFAEGGDVGSISPTRANQSNTLGGSQQSLPQLPQGRSMSEMVSEPKQGQGLGMESLNNAPQPRMTDMTAPNASVQPAPAKVETPNTGSSVGEYGGYAQQALALYQAYAAMKNANKMDPQPPAQLGQMNLQPTANRFGV